MADSTPLRSKTVLSPWKCISCLGVFDSLDRPAWTHRSAGGTERECTKCYQDKQAERSAEGMQDGE